MRNRQFIDTNGSGRHRWVKTLRRQGLTKPVAKKIIPAPSPGHLAGYLSHFYFQFGGYYDGFITGFAQFLDLKHQEINRFDSLAQNCISTLPLIRFVSNSLKTIFSHNSYTLLQ